MKAVAAFLLVLCYLAVSHAWTCKEAPRLYNAVQVDAGQGKVVARDRNYAYFLISRRWSRLSTTRIKHVSVGPAGLWATSSSNKVYKYIAGDLRASNGLYMQQVDAGGNDQVVGVASTYGTYCLKSTIASAYRGVGSLSWSSLSRTMGYYSCGPLYGCWGVDRSNQVYVTQRMYPTSCSTSGWTQVAGLRMKMVEVGTDGSVFGVSTSGQVYQRSGISSSRPQGVSWVSVSMCMAIRHVSYDLGTLWVVTSSGLIMQCSH